MKSLGIRSIAQRVDRDGLCGKGIFYKLYLMQCIERCMAENFPIQNFVLDEIPFSDEENVIMDFSNPDTGEQIDFMVNRKSPGYAIPLRYHDHMWPNEIMVNTVRKAIHHPKP